MDTEFRQHNSSKDSWQSNVSDWLHSCVDDYLLCTTECEQQDLASPPPPTLCSTSIQSNYTSRKRERSMASDASSLRSGTTPRTFSEHSFPRPKTPRTRSSSPSRKTLHDLRDATPSVKLLQPDRNVTEPPIVQELRTRLYKRLLNPYIPKGFQDRLHESNPALFEVYAHLVEPETTFIGQSGLDLQWAQIQKIYSQAQMAHERPLDESHWTLVTQIVLESAIETPESLLRICHIQTQRIERALLPIHDGQPFTKQADIALGFDSRTAQHVVSRTTKACPSLALSQMAEPSTRKIPLACGLELKATNGDQNEALSQLAIWSAAGLARLEQLSTLAQRHSDKQREDTIVDNFGILPLVGWTVVGHDWRFYVSWKDESGDVVVLGPWSFLNANTLSHVDIIRLLALIREVKLWLEDVYWKMLQERILSHLV